MTANKTPVSSSGEEPLLILPPYNINSAEAVVENEENYPYIRASLTDISSFLDNQPLFSEACDEKYEERYSM